MGAILCNCFVVYLQDACKCWNQGSRCQCSWTYRESPEAERWRHPSRTYSGRYFFHCTKWSAKVTRNIGTYCQHWSWYTALGCNVCLDLAKCFAVPLFNFRLQCISRSRKVAGTKLFFVLLSAQFALLLTNVLISVCRCFVAMLCIILNRRI